MTNLTSGKSNMKAYQFARGYPPSISGLSSSGVIAYMQLAHMQATSSRAIQRVLSSCQPKLMKQNMIKKGDTIWVFHKSSKKKEPVGWMEASVIKASDHFVECKRATKRPAMKVAYEHVINAPSSKLARELKF